MEVIVNGNIECADAFVAVCYDLYHKNAGVHVCLISTRFCFCFVFIG